LLEVENDAAGELEAVLRFAEETGE